MVDSNIFRQAWGKYPTGVAVVTSIESDGHVHGMAANGINSVSLDPLLVLVCVGHNRNSYSLIRDTGRFAINMLSEDQEFIASYYAGPPENRKDDSGINFTFTDNGSAFIDGSFATMDCKVVNEYVAGDHSIFIGEVDEIDVHSGKPLVYCEGKFLQLDDDGIGA